MSCEHKFRTNVDGLQSLSKSDSKLMDNVYTSGGALSNYFTIIFCEKCGLVSYDANRKDAYLNGVQRQLTGLESEK